MCRHPTTAARRLVTRRIHLIFTGPHGFNISHAHPTGQCHWIEPAVCSSWILIEGCCCSFTDCAGVLQVSCRLLGKLALHPSWSFLQVVMWIAVRSSCDESARRGRGVSAHERGQFGQAFQAGLNMNSLYLVLRSPLVAHLVTGCHDIVMSMWHCHVSVTLS